MQLLKLYCFFGPLRMKFSKDNVMNEYLDIIKTLGVNIPIVALIAIIPVIFRRTAKTKIVKKKINGKIRKRTIKIDPIFDGEKQSIILILGLSLVAGLANSIQFVPLFFKVALFFTVTGSYVFASILLFILIKKLFSGITK